MSLVVLRRTERGLAGRIAVGGFGLPACFFPLKFRARHRCSDSMDATLPS